MDLIRDLMAVTYVGMIRTGNLVGTVLVLPDELKAAEPLTKARQVGPPGPTPPTWGALPRLRDMFESHVGLDLTSGT